MLLKLQIATLLLCGLVAGCGQVSVFGRTIGENSATPAVKADTAQPGVAPVPPLPTKQGAVSPIQAQPTQAQPLQAPKIQTLKSVTLVLTSQVVSQTADDARFNADLLRATIKSELQKRKLLNEADSQASAATITIDEYSMRPTSNAIVFGKIISTGALKGSLLVSDGRGTDLQNRRIDTETRVSIPATGESKNPLEGLYRDFAINAANALDGTPPKPVIGADQHPR